MARRRWRSSSRSIRSSSSACSAAAPGTNRDTFELLYQAEKYGARVALFGRKINLAESQLDIVHFMRLVADGEMKPLEAVRAYHAVLKDRSVPAVRSLEDDCVITETVLKEGASA